MKVHDLEIDQQTRTVRRGGKVINLTGREYDVLEFLIEKQGTVVTQSMILQHLYKHVPAHRSSLIDVYVRQLGTKVDGEFDKRLIVMHRGRVTNFWQTSQSSKTWHSASAAWTPPERGCPAQHIQTRARHKKRLSTGMLA